MDIGFIGTATADRSNQQMVQNKLEQVFLEEMLKYVRPSALQGSFGGGHGEEQFSTFMNREYAQLMAARVDLGLGPVK